MRASESTVPGGGSARGGAPRPFSEHILLLVKWRRVIATNVVVITIATAVISLIVPSWYTSTGSLLPSEGGASETGIFSMIESTFPLLGIPGVSAPSETMVAILGSRTVAEEVIRANDLERIYRSRTMDHAVDALKHHVRIEVTENGVVRVRAEARDPVRASRIVESFMDALERYNLEVRSTRGRRTREFVEERLAATERELGRSEEALADFQEEHASIEIGEQARAAIEALAQLEAEAIAAEVQLGIVRSYASEAHPEARQLESRVREYREALGDLREGGVTGRDLPPALAELPALALDLARLTRSVEVQNRVYLLLVQELETAKIQETRDTPTVQVLDAPRPAEVRTRPRRKLMVFLGAVIGLVVGVVMAYAVQFYSSTDGGNPTRRNLDAAIGMLRSDVARLRRRRGVERGDRDPS